VWLVAFVASGSQGGPTHLLDLKDTHQCKTPSCCEAYVAQPDPLEAYDEGVIRVEICGGCRG